MELIGYIFLIKLISVGLIVTEIQTKIIKGRVFEAQVIDGDIFHLSYLPNEHCSGCDFKAGYEAYDILREGRVLKVIVENGKYTVIDNSAREYLENNKFEAIAAAIIMHSIAQRILYNFYVRFRKQDYPIKAFKNLDKAIEWLNKL